MYNILIITILVGEDSFFFYIIVGFVCQVSSYLLLPCSSLSFFFLDTYDPLLNVYFFFNFILVQAVE